MGGGGEDLIGDCGARFWNKFEGGGSTVFGLDCNCAGRCCSIAPACACWVGGEEEASLGAVLTGLWNPFSK